jgi:hypothetical protein
MPETAQWTWLVYMAGDNNLESAGKEDLDEMRQVGSTPQVNVLVQFDTEENKTTRYRVEKKRLRTVGRMPGVDCGDPKVLTDFIRWGIEHYPAEHYLVDVWNHGGGWENLPADFDYDSIRSAKPALARKLQRIKRSLFRTTAHKIASAPETTRAIAIDCGSHDYLDNQELQTAIAKALPDGRKLDILGCDACLMNMLEIAYEMKDTVGVLVGSEETEPAAGWPYAVILSALTATPGMSAAELGRTIAGAYGDWYQRHGSIVRDRAATQSALDIGQIAPVAQSVNALAGALLKDLGPSSGAIALARQKAQAFEYPEYVDLGDFAAQLIQRLPSGAPSTAEARAVQAALGAFVTENKTWGRGVNRATGVSIYFPTDERDYAPDYAALKFTQDVCWDKLLQAFFKI